MLQQQSDMQYWIHTSIKSGKMNLRINIMIMYIETKLQKK